MDDRGGGNVDPLLVNHRRACDGFSRVADGVSPDGWDVPTPCTEWDARALVEHVIGFHDFLLLRPLGVRAHRPREGPADRWRATATALFDALSVDGALDQETELPSGGTSAPRTMLAALTTDVLVHTWDLARATGVDVSLDPVQCGAALERARASGVGRDSGMVGPEVPVDDDADMSTQLAAFYGRNPSWTAPPWTATE
jgi:uncharacterized protein (TIGR03086 family)